MVDGGDSKFGLSDLINIYNKKIMNFIFKIYKNPVEVLDLLKIKGKGYLKTANAEIKRYLQREFEKSLYGETFQETKNEEDIIFNQRVKNEILNVLFRPPDGPGSNILAPYREMIGKIDKIIDEIVFPDVESINSELKKYIPGFKLTHDSISFKIADELFKEFTGDTSKAKDSITKKKEELQTQLLQLENQLKAIESLSIS